MTLSELRSRYTGLTLIKRGGQKVVFRGLMADGTPIALKIISAANDPRVLQEIALVQTLSLPNVPRILESGTVKDESIDDEVLYIVEEYIEGTSLRDWLTSGNKANLQLGYVLLESLLIIECELEKNSILHRDINPNNIMIGTDNTIRLIDFGLAKNLMGPSYTLTAAAHGPFTPGYAPNEQFTNKKMLQDVRTDLFQIGVTVYETCVGTNPFVKKGEDILQIMSRTMTDIPPSLRLEGDTNGLFAQLVNMLMAKNQSQRPDTAAAALRYLHAIRPTLVWED